MSDTLKKATSNKTVEQFKAEVLDVVKRYQEGVTYIDFERNIDGFEGDYEFSVLENLVVWQGVNENALQAICDLTREKKIQALPSSPLVYMHDGKVLRMPVAKRIRAHKTPRWIPTCYSYINEEK